ncbi:MAG: hypothetical protein ACU85E_11620 [Gammaproteobacteria bacterium]
MKEHFEPNFNDLFTITNRAIRRFDAFLLAKDSSKTG